MHISQYFMNKRKSISNSLLQRIFSELSSDVTLLHKSIINENREEKKQSHI